MALLDVGVSSSPTSQGAAGSRTLDSSPPMPPRQRRPPSPLFTPPMDDGSGMSEMGGDPMVQTMAATKAVDMAFQKLAVLYPEAVDPLAQLQQSFRQLVTGLMTMSMSGGMGAGMEGGMGGGMGAPNIVPPLPMQGGTSPGMQQGPGI